MGDLSDANRTIGSGKGLSIGQAAAPRNIRRQSRFVDAAVPKMDVGALRKTERHIRIAPIRLWPPVGDIKRIGTALRNYLQRLHGGSLSLPGSYGIVATRTYLEDIAERDPAFLYEVGHIEILHDIA